MQDHPQDDGIQTGLTSNRVRQSITDGMQSVEVDYSLQVEDVLAFQDYHLARTTEAARSSLWWAFPVFFLLIGSLAFFNVIMDWKRAGVREIIIAAISTAFVAGYFFRRPLLRAKLRRDLRHEQSLFLPHRVVVTPDAIEHRVGPNTIRSLWEGVAKIGLTERHLLLYLTPDRAIVVPCRAFGSEHDFDSFCKLTQRYFRIKT